MGWKEFDAFVFSIGVVIALAVFTQNNLYDFGFSTAFISVLKSILFGIILFLLFVIVSSLLYIIFHGKAEAKKTESGVYEKERRRKMRRIHVIGLVILIFSVAVFLNSFLYLKALLGNDMLVSLKVDDENLVLQNGEVGEINVKAKVLTNPFCQANCSLILEDLSKNEIIDYESMYLQVSSPLSQSYLVSIDEGNSGQRLYRARLECNTTKTALCYVASKSTKSRTKIISVDHVLNDIQKIRQEELKNKTEKMNNEFYTIRNNLMSRNYYFNVLDLSGLEMESSKLYNLSGSILYKLRSINNLYGEQKYYEMEEDLSALESEFGDFINKGSTLETSFYGSISQYNALVYNLNAMYNESVYFVDYNFSNYSIDYAEDYVNNFNKMVASMQEHNTIENKTALFIRLEEERDNLLILMANESISDILKENMLNISINPFSLSLINYNPASHYSNFTLVEPSPICCLNNECYKCVDDSSVNYPVILVHGHSFNDKISAELSLEAFSEMASKLDEDGYVEAGDLYGDYNSELSEGVLGKINKSIVFKTTYYINALETEEGSFILDSKTDNISIYADRLKEAVSNVKYITGKDKVIIIAHSMGGLVTRKYIQVYGEDDIDRVILVTIPNHGVDGRVISSCPILGAEAECADLAKNSPFLTELNSFPVPSVPVYNFVGEGCFWENSKGDGIVKSDSAYLEGVHNIYVNGTCSGIDFFHVNVIKPSKYPDIYEKIKGCIKE